MNPRWTLLPTLALVLLSAVPAHAAVTVAVMPVKGVNLTEGQCDAIGVMFASAFARETNVAVATPIDTKPVVAETKTNLAAATRLGVFEYIELSAVQLGNKTTLAATRFSREGKEVFRAEATAASLDDMQGAAARLARSLAWAQPSQRPPEAVLPGYAPLPPPPPAGPKPYPAALGLKSALIYPLASGHSFAPLMSLQFDARIGPRNAFAEVGAGAAIPSTTASGSDTIEMGGVFAEFGGGYYLSEGSVAPYVGGGVSPRIWIVDTRSGSSTSGATCTVHGMAGVTFTRDIRARVFAEVRAAQYVIGLAHDTGTSVGTVSSSTYYPTELSLLVGIGW
jgi:hypothetical protein